MSRAATVFAVAAITLLAAGIILSRIAVRSSVGVTFPVRHNMAYEIPVATVLFGFASFFGVSAFVYSLWMIRMNRTATVWHFWLSVVGVLLFGLGFTVMAKLPPPSSPLGGIRIAALFVYLLAYPVFLGGQAVFATNFIVAIVRRNTLP